MVERTLLFGVLLFIILFILNSKLTTISKKKLSFKLSVFFGVLTLLFLAVGGISDEFSGIAVVTFILTLISMGISIVQYIVKILNGKIDVFLAFFFLTIVLCEVYTRIDPYGYFIYFLFNKIIDVHKYEIYAIIGFIIFLSIKIFAGIFFKKDLNFLDKNHFQVKDGKGK